MSARLTLLALLLPLCLAGARPPGAPGAEPSEGVRVVVVDPGHGGADFGARGESGLLEKDLALQVSERLATALRGAGYRVVLTRSADRFVSLADRTEIANRAEGDLFLSIHANAAEDPGARGVETYFLSVDASDADARRVALAENSVFDQASASPEAADIVGGILGDLIRTEQLRLSSAVAAAIQSRLAHLPGSSRGVKQAPFVVLMGVNMPAVLIEAGFLTNRDEERRLATRQHQEALASAVVGALRSIEAAAP